jgi:phosphatidylinositol alpha-1,6-mannosyltransferase
MANGPRVLFVSKPIVPPWNDGSKNLVRDVAAHLRHARPTVMSIAGASAPAEGVHVDHVYHANSGFSPALSQNARVLMRLLSKDSHDAWAFVFAPNPKSSYVAKGAVLAARLRGFRGKVVQIVASTPDSFDGVSRLLFGDVVVALSDYTRGSLLGAGVSRDVRVIPPCARPLRTATRDEVAKVRADYDLGEGPIVLYPGDYETSTGAETVMRAIATVSKTRPDARFLFACRSKSAESHYARAEIEGEILGAGLGPFARHAGDVPDMAPLVAAASVIAFPVDDLYGKVDVPLVLIEAMAHGVPMVVCRGGPLTALKHAPTVEPEEPEELARELLRILDDPDAAARVAGAGQRLYHASFSPEHVARAYDALFSEIAG